MVTKETPKASPPCKSLDCMLLAALLANPCPSHFFEIRLTGLAAEIKVWYRQTFVDNCQEAIEIILSIIKACFNIKMMRKFYKYFLSLNLSCLTLLCFGQQNGIITTQRSAPVGLVSLTQASNFTGVSNTHHVDGYVKKYDPGVFVFPVGNKGSYMPFVADADNTIGAYFKEDPGTATLPSGGPYPASNKESALNKISTTEFWDINGTNSTRITLSWKSESNITDLTDNSLSKVGIAGWNAAASRWENLPALIDGVSVYGGSSTLATGSVTTVSTVVPNAYSIFTLASTVATPAQANFAGTFEDVNCSEITGWAWDQNYPNAALTLELVEGTTVHATFTANKFRQDLKNAGTGTGNYGFSLPLPINLRDGNAHELSVRVRSNNYTLAGSSKTVKCGYEGSFELADCYKVQGWVRDKDYANIPLEVELVEGNIVRATTTANMYREDLETMGIGNGKYGFIISIPAGLRNSQNKQLSIRIKNSSYMLSGSPRTVNCTPSSFAGSFETADCNLLQGWIWDRNYPNTPLVIEVVEGNTVHVETTANLYRGDLQNAGYGTGSYAFSIPIPANLRNGQPRQLSIKIKNTNTILGGSPKTINCTAAVVPLYAGSVESADCNVVKGWIWDKNNPNSAFTVELFEGSTVYATATANTYRGDLKNLGYGTGNYGFSFTVPETLKNGQPRQLSVRIKDVNYTLTGSPKTINCTAAVVPLYAGSVESADCNVVKGWIWDKNNPNSAFTVELFEGSTVYATATANTYRGDLKNLGYGTGNYGFSFTVPETLKNGQPRQLSVRIKDVNYTLTGSPKTINCTAAVVPLYAGSVESADCNVVKGWIWDKNNPNSALTVELFEGSTVYATATANTYRGDLKNLGYGTGNYGFSFTVPETLKNGQPRQLSVRIKDVNYTLTGSPKTINCTAAVVPLYAGSVESADCNVVKGWIWDKNNPNSAFTVELFEGSTVYATATANTYRGDLKNLGYGTGNYGFSFTVPETLKNGQPRQLSVRIKDINYTVGGSPKTINCTAAVVPLYAGSVESADCNVVKGWIWDKNNPNSAFTVELFEGSTVYATATANTYRGDLKNLGYGTGNYGFSFTIPETLKNGQPRQLSVRIKDVNYTVGGSPKTINCTAAVVPLYAGSVESADCNAINGWIWDKNNPNSEFTVELFEGSTVYATATANTYRGDLKNLGYGTGNYGFSFTVPETLKNGQPRQLSVRIKDVNYTLTGSPKTINCTAAVVPLYAGSVESADCNVVKGWIWDKNNPNSAFTVELFEGSTVYATATANTYRGDLKNLGYGTGNYGFSFTVPETLKNGQPRQLSVRIKDVNYTLTGSPKTINCTAAVVPLYAGSVESADCNVVKGWIWDKNNPNSAFTVELFEGSTVYATATANTYRGDLKNLGYGTGNYGFSFTVPETLKNGQPRQLSVRIKDVNYTVGGSPKTINCTAAVVPLYAGSVESADCNVVKGWIWDKNNPNSAFTVELFEGSTVYATATANTYRGDLKNLGYGTGNYGFSFTVPETLKNGQPRQLSVRIKDINYTVGGSPKTINCTAAVVPLYAGGFDAANCNTVTGWAWDKNNPAGALTLELVEGTTVHATGIANTYRADLKNAGYGTGNYGFSIPVPESLKNGQPRQLSVRVKNGNYTLGSAKTITCNSSARLGVQDGGDQKPNETPGRLLTVSPNPTDGVIQIGFEQVADKRVTISIVNMLGRAVWEKVIIGTGKPEKVSADLREQADGIYLVQMKTGEKIQVRRILLVK